MRSRAILTKANEIYLVMFIYKAIAMVRATQGEQFRTESRKRSKFRQKIAQNLKVPLLLLKKGHLGAFRKVHLRDIAETADCTGLWPRPRES